jgi:hypothetical protein
VLTRVAAALLLFGASAAAQTAEGLRRPERLTAGASDEFLGTLDPAGRTIYFVSNENATTQIFAQDVLRGAPRQLFDDSADVTWPRVSPDGKWLLYISFQRDAAGDVCLRELANPGKRRCLTDAATAESQALWLDAGHIAAVSRRGLHEDLQLVRIPVGGGAPEPLVRHNLSSPAVSPDGRWLAYVPVERDASEVGVSFAVRAGKALEIARPSESGGGAPARVQFDLPGASGFPAFSTDGRWLYFSQYLNDTNFDGIIDGNDHSVLFRAPFADGRVDQARVEQLTGADWNCQYPSPARDRLIATCLYQGSLDVYSLPLDGSVPSGWTQQKLDDELSATPGHWAQLLLYSRRLALEPNAERRAALLKQVIRLHLGLGEYESAQFYTDQVARLGSPSKAPGFVAAVTELIAHRRGERALDRGTLSEAYVVEARARLGRLQALTQGTPPSVSALARLVMSEVYDVIGDKDRALAALPALSPTEPADPFYLHAYAERALDMERQTDDREALLAVYRVLATHPSLTERERLAYGAAFVRELLRGHTRPEQAQLLGAWRGKLDPDGELAFLIDLEWALFDLAPTTEETVRAAVFELFKRHRSFDRRKALVDATVERALHGDYDFLLYQFANSWISLVDRGQAERRHAETLYRRSVLERAYVEEVRGDFTDARGHFFGVTLQSDSLESHAGFIEARLKEHVDVAAEYAKRYAGKPDHPVYRYAQAYLLARRLPSLRDDLAFARDAEAAQAHLEVAARGVRHNRELHHLWAFVAHQRYLRSGDKLLALEANTHYLLALDLAREQPRARAPLLEGLGLLQSEVGNYGLALQQLDEREKLPYPPGDEAAHLSLCAARARSLFHLGRDRDAATAADACVELAKGALAPMLPLLVDRSALYHLAAHAPAEALARYQKLVPLVESTGARNRLTARLGRAAAALGAGQAAAALDDLRVAQTLIDDPATPLQPPPDFRHTPSSLREPRVDYQLLVDGLRAAAHQQLGQLDQATRAMTRRRDALARRVQASGVDEDRIELALAEAHLAEYAQARHDGREARARLEAALKQSDAYGEKTGTPVHETGLALLRGFVELQLFGGESIAEMPERLEQSYARLCQARNPAWEEARARFELYLTLLHLEPLK